MSSFAAIRERLSPGYCLALLGVAAAMYWSTLPGEPPVEVRSVSVEDARMLIAGGALVVDVRIPDQAIREHVPGARLIPLESLADDLPRMGAAARERTVVVYCGTGRGRGEEATALLQKAGFSKAVNLETGFEGWRAAGLPTARG